MQKHSEFNSFCSQKVLLGHFWYRGQSFKSLKTKSHQEQNRSECCFTQAACHSPPQRCIPVKELHQFILCWRGSVVTGHYHLEQQPSQFNRGIGQLVKLQQGNTECWPEASVSSASCVPESALPTLCSTLHFPLPYPLLAPSHALWYETAHVGGWMSDRLLGLHSGVSLTLVMLILPRRTIAPVPHPSGWGQAF